MKNNYPIKYAVMPLYEQVGWLNELDRKYDVVAYIISKCHVLSEIKKYSTDGNIHLEYQVVFPYEKRDHSTWERIAPEFNLINYESTNSTIVKNVFTNYEEALKMAEIQNKEILDKKIRLLPYSANRNEEISKLKKAQEDTIQKYKKLEAQIEESTNDLKINEIPKEQNIIYISEATEKILNISLYNFIRIFSIEPFYVCNVSKEEYDLMKEQIIEKGMLEERNAKNLDLSYNKFRYLLANDTKNNIIRIADIDSVKEKGSFYLSDEKMYYDENMYPFYKDPVFSPTVHGIKIYTTETYEDIIKSFIPNFVFKNNETEIKIKDDIIVKKLTMK